MKIRFLLLTALVTLPLLATGCGEEQCPSCGGRGRVTRQNILGHEYQVPCSRCAGDGQIGGPDALTVRLRRNPVLWLRPALLLLLYGGGATSIWRAMKGKKDEPQHKESDPAAESSPPPSPPSNAVHQGSGAAIPVECSGCGAEFRVASRYAGRAAKCKKCGTRFRVPVNHVSGSKPSPPPRPPHPDPIPPPPPSLRSRRTRP